MVDFAFQIKPYALARFVDRVGHAMFDSRRYDKVRARAKRHGPPVSEFIMSLASYAKEHFRGGMMVPVGPYGAIVSQSGNAVKPSEFYPTMVYESTEIGKGVLGHGEIVSNMLIEI